MLWPLRGHVEALRDFLLAFNVINAATSVDYAGIDQGIYAVFFLYFAGEVGFPFPAVLADPELTSWQNNVRSHNDYLVLRHQRDELVNCRGEPYALSHQVMSVVSAKANKQNPTVALVSAMEATRCRAAVGLCLLNRTLCKTTLRVNDC